MCKVSIRQRVHYGPSVCSNLSFLPVLICWCHDQFSKLADLLTPICLGRLKCTVTNIILPTHMNLTYICSAYLFCASARMLG